MRDNIDQKKYEYEHFESNATYSKSNNANKGINWTIDNKTEIQISNEITLFQNRLKSLLKEDQ